MQIQSFQGLWNTAQGIAGNLFSKNSSSNKTTGISALSSTGKTGSSLLSSGPLSIKNNAAGLKPLDLLMSETSKSISLLASTNKFTSNLDLSGIFKSTFSMSAFQKSASSMTSQMASGTISGLTKNIFSAATSKNNMSNQQKGNLLMTLMSGANLGFMNAGNILSESNQLTAQIKQVLSETASMYQHGMDAFYNANIQTGSDVADVIQATVEHPKESASQRVADEEQAQDNIVTDTEQDAVPEAAVPQNPPADGTEDSNFDSTDTATLPPIAKPEEMATAITIVKDMYDRGVFFTSASMFSFDYDGIENAGDPYFNDVYSIELGTDGVARIVKDYSSFSGLDLRDGTTHVIKNEAGQEFSFKYLDYNSVEIDGTMMDAKQFTDWAESNDFASIDNYSSQLNRFYARIDTPTGDMYVEIGNKYTPAPDNPNQIAGYSSIANPNYESRLQGFFDTKDGTRHYFDTIEQQFLNLDADLNYVLLDGKGMNAEDMKAFAVQNGLESSTVTTDNHTVTSYFVDIVSDNGEALKVAFYEEFDGVGVPIGKGTGVDTRFVDSAGAIHNYNFRVVDPDEASFDAYHEIDGKVLSAEESVSWAKDHGMKTTSSIVDGQEVKGYFITDPTGVREDIIFAVEIDDTARDVWDYDPQRFNVWKSGYISPITIDLEGDGIQDVGVEQGVNFDLAGSGEAVRTGWTSDALLALDRDGSGAIESGKELFGDQHGAANGYEELAKFDDNADGVINAQDAVFDRLQVWRDANMNGISEAGELSSLKDVGVASINLNYTEPNQKLSTGNILGQKSSFTRVDGTTGTTADLWFQYTGTKNYMDMRGLSRDKE